MKQRRQLPQQYYSNDMIGWTRKNNRAARAARNVVHSSVFLCQKKKKTIALALLYPVLWLV